jgi:UMF1 family MFS transporter
MLKRIQNRREVFGWAMFDFANSSFTTVIVTTLFPIYFVEHLAAGRGDASFLWSLAIAISQALVVLSAPLLGALADFTGAKKRLLLVTYLGCVGMTAVLGLTTGVVAAMAVFVFANFFFSTGENVVAGFLPEIAAPEDIGKVSGFGWALGYIGGIGSLFLANHLSRSAGTGAGANLVVCLVTAVFFLLAGTATFRWVRERKSREELPPGETLLTIGFRRVSTTWRHVRDFRQLLRFLVVFLVYSAGITTVVAFCSIYARQGFGFTQEEVVGLFLAVSLASTIGALVFGILQDRLGSRRVIQLTLALWTVVVLTAAITTSHTVFWIAGFGVGLCIGASQSASRALVAIFSPSVRTGEFLGFWGSFGKLPAVIGPIVFGAISDTVNPRTAVAVTSVWFAAGFLGMFLVDEKQGRAEARAADEADGYVREE